MEPKYTAQRVEGTDNGWMLTDNETGKKHLVFCNVNANTAEDAVALIEDRPDGDLE
jgi:hypothetical protein